MEKIAILDYGTGNVTILCNVPQEVALNPNKTKQYLVDKGFKPENCHWMSGAEEIIIK